ncbi:MAG: hypothetical protein IJ354_10440 [Clostridia bacterium]|nr:hypothetical protein [Clostridia bacterium]
MAQADALLRPIPRDALLRTSSDSFGTEEAKANEVMEAIQVSVVDEAAVPEIVEIQSLIPEPIIEPPAIPDELTDLLAAFDAADPDDDPDDEPDAVDSATMPMPACVPLLEPLSTSRKTLHISGSAVAGALMVLAGIALACTVMP